MRQLKRTPELCFLDQVIKTTEAALEHSSVKEKVIVFLFARAYHGITIR